VKKAPAFLAIGAAYCFFWAGTAETTWRKYTIAGQAQGTTYAITYYAMDNVVRKEAIDSILAVIDSSMSLYKPYSLINSINSSKAGTVEIDEHFRNVLTKSLEIYRDSKGMFDVTVAPLVALWGFGVKPVVGSPDSVEVREALGCVGMDKIRLKGNRLKKKKGCVQLDVNGIAQGYSVDVMANYLERRGVIHYVVELGGELRVKGTKPDGSPMRIGIERPTDRDAGEVAVDAVIEVREGAITTASNYHKSHHINPKTGYPFATEIISATIYAKDAMTADGYDNVIMAMKADDAIRFVHRRNNMEVYIVYKDFAGVVRDTMSAGFKELIAN